jgi:RimJ/RimL family protein N-acetyltransferase
LLPMIIDTPRLHLRFWQDSDRVAFAAMNADPEVMHDLGGPIDVAESNAKFDRYAAAQHQRGFGRWLVETHDGNFVGYTGILKAHLNNHPLGEHFEIGWRLMRSDWGKGYATEAAKAALEDVFSRVRLPEVLAYTAPENVRSQAVMRRLALKRDPSRDFTAQYDKGVWQGLVWFAQP